jgi:hypothetical protein
MIHNKKYHLIVLILFSIIINSCSINYSFTGASISPDIKTVSVDFFPNRALMVNPNLSQVFTEKLKDTFLNQTNLDLVKNDGDLQFSGAIVDYRTSPVAITGDMASQTRLTITVQVSFVNTKDPDKNFDKKFSQYEDYSSDQSLDAVQDQLVSEIVDKLTNDIFNASVSNW